MENKVNYLTKARRREDCTKLLRIKESVSNALFASSAVLSVCVKRNIIMTFQY